MSTRAEFVDALAPLAPLVRGSEKYKQTVRPGDAWPRLAGKNRAASGLGYVETWELLLVLPQSISDAETWLEQHLDTVLDTLNAARLFAGGVASVTPTELQLGANVVNAVIFQGAREG